MDLKCFECGEKIEASDMAALGEEFLGHARSQHEWPYPDHAIRNYADATQRLTGSGDRLEEIGEISVEEVDESRIDDWLSFFDHDAFVGKPEWAACYCLEPHVRVPGEPSGDDAASWRDNRTAMMKRLKNGESFGYLAYIGGHAGGWVNASKRHQYSLYRNVDPGGPDAASVIGVSCFIIAPPYRRHDVAAALLDRVIEDAANRGASWIEGYPFNEEADFDAGSFRGPMSMYQKRGFRLVEVRSRDTVVRRPVTPGNGSNP